MRNFWAFFGATVLASPGVYFVFKFAESLSTFEKIATIVFPVLLGASFFFISDWSMQRALARERSFLTGKIDAFVIEARKNKATIYSTKKTVPNGGEYWNELARTADKNLVIIGASNKSWFNKDDGQSRRLLADFSRIISAGGNVSIVSLNKKPSLDIMRNFVDRHCRNGRSGASIPFSFHPVDILHYAAILADDRLVLMPIPMEDSFRDDAAVIEIVEAEHPQVYRNYRSDIERLINRSPKFAFS